MHGKHGSKRMLGLALGIAGGLALAGPAAAQQAAVAAPPSQRTIRVTGIGEARARPDAARLTFAVETFAATASEAGQENARVMERVVAALVAAGVPRTEIETRNFTVFPEYSPDQPLPAPVPEPPAQRIRGYRATNQVVLRTDRLDRVGALIDVALDAGANRVDGLAFELREAGPVQAEALRQAVERARAAAQTLAASLGVTLGEVLDATTGVMPVQPMPMAFQRAEMMAPDAAASTPIEPGEQTVHANVTLVFAIR